MTRLVILGRDGVINHYDGSTIATPEALEPIAGSLEAVARLNHAGLKVAVATNQPGIAAGRLDLDALNAVHARLQQMLARVGGHIDGIFVCPHQAQDGCGCRKPAPGLLVAIAQRFGVPLHGIPLIGRSAHDQSAALAVGARPLILGNEKENGNGDCRFDDLQHAVEHLLSELK